MSGMSKPTSGTPSLEVSVGSDGPRAGHIVLPGIAAYLMYSIHYRWRNRPRNTSFQPFVNWLGPFGNLPYVVKVIAAALSKNQLKFFHEMHTQLGKTVAFKLPLTPWWVMTRDPKNVQHILSTHFDNYPKGPFVREILVDLLGGGIFNADGSQWLHQRKTASRMFTQKLFKEHIWYVVRRKVKKLEEILSEVQPGQNTDVFHLMNRFTLDTIGEIGFGKSIGSLEDPTSPFLKSFDRAQQISFTRFFVFLWKPLRWLGCFTESETKEHLERLDDYSRSVVRELRENIAREERGESSPADFEARKSFLGLFLQEALKTGEDLSEDYLRDLVLNFLIAGRDTTAQAISWTIYLLCRHPKVVEKARAEVRRVCCGSDLVWEDLNRLPYLQAIISEAMRLYPSVPVGIKHVLQDDILPDGTEVRRGNCVLFNVYSMGRDTSNWGPDAESFRPERWLEMDSVADSYMYPVFNAGPRECLGKRLALVEMKACLATLLPKFEFTLAAEPEDVVVDAQLTIGMARGLPCTVELRGKAELSDLYGNAAAELSTDDGGTTSDGFSMSSGMLGRRSYGGGSTDSSHGRSAAASPTREESSPSASVRSAA